MQAGAERHELRRNSEQQAMVCDAAMTTCIAAARARHTSSNFLRCATLTPNMPGMVSLGGVTWVQGGDKEGRHEISRDGADFFESALQCFTIVLSAV
jgi:hypothetical protein